MISAFRMAYHTQPPENDLKVSLDENCVIWMGKRVELTRTETELMALFKPGEVLTYDDAIVGLHGQVTDPPSDTSIRVHISHIRRKLRSKGIPVMIATELSGRRETRGWRLVYGYDKYGA